MNKEPHHATAREAIEHALFSQALGIKRHDSLWCCIEMIEGKYIASIIENEGTNLTTYHAFYISIGVHEDTIDFNADLETLREDEKDAALYKDASPEDPMRDVEREEIVMQASISWHGENIDRLIEETEAYFKDYIF